MEAIFAKNGPAAIGPYCHAMKAGNLVFISGQVPLDPKTGKTVGSTMAEQAKQALANLKVILDEVGLKAGNIAKTTCYISDFSKFSEFNGVYAEFMGDHRPARACVEIPNLPAGCMVEIEAIAVIE